MTIETLFSAVNLSVMPAWALLILAPNWRGTAAIVHSMFYPLLLGGIYIAGLIATMFFGMGADGAGFTTIAGVRQIFASDMGVVVGWAHFLIFDLFVGAWEARDARRKGFSHWLLIPCLLLTFMFGPVGLVVYLVLRKVTGKGGWGLGEV
ncbi:ABA4-like family protein [Fretibacter rubidus]|uniref:ABA4-like family protein n=1 Tax=Fretibacter rubidus TaxID=570162 RepID=UPI00352AEBAC